MNPYQNPPGMAPPNYGGQQYGQPQYGQPQYGSASDFLPQPTLAPTASHYATQYPSSSALGSGPPMAPPPFAPQPSYNQYPQQYGQGGLAPPPQYAPPPPQYAPPPQQFYPPQQYAPPPQQVNVIHHAPPPPVAIIPAQRVPVIYTMQLGCVGLDRKDVFSKSDPFLILSAKRTLGAYGHYTTHGGTSAGDWAIVHRTETIMNNHKPIFKPFQIDLNLLCNNNMDQPFLVECYDWDANTKHDFIGSCQTSVRELQIMKEMPLKNPNRKSLITDIAGRLNLLRFEPAVPSGVVQQVQATGAPPVAVIAPQAQPAGGY